ncbi:MAG: NAD(P)/FAD-dependent oxidoreductase, partial [Clostridia bacterium]|nr:NAD(P)/FAD-dependent oxidoreductase [Clostridia bacterium]
MKVSKYVIIGNSTAAVGAVEAIRKTDKANEIVIISDETYHTYSRPLISYMLLGKTTRDKMKYRADSFYEDNNCSLILNKKAVKINPQSKTVVLDDGKELSYEKLLVATGSCPFVPPIMGLDTVKNKFTFMSLKDALALEEVLNDKAKVLIIGAGLIGLKCAEGIKNRVGEINIVDLAPKVLSSILDDEAAAHIKKHLEANGLNFYLADSVKELKENTAELTSGKNIDFDILVLAVG